MSYAKATHRLLAGSLNLRARPTEIPDDDNTRAVNLAYDQAGGLRSRKGHQDICTASAPVSQMIHAINARWQATDTAYIAGFKKYVWKMGGGTADKNCSSIIKTAGPRKSQGTKDWRWIPKAPADKPTIKTAATVETTVDDFSGGWDIDPPDTVTGYDLHGVQGLFIQGDPGIVVSATKNVGLNLYDGFDNDDVFKIIVAAKKWSRVAGVSFEVDVNNGDFTTDYYRCKMPLKDIIAARKESITIYIRKHPQDVDVAANSKFRYGVFERVGQTTDKDWRSVVALRVKVEIIDDGSGFGTRFWFRSWTMIGNEDNTLEGDDFRVYYTYTTDDGHESNPSPPSDSITVNHGSINVTDLADSDDEQVTGKHVYLTGGSLGAVYRCDGAKEAADGADDPGPVTGTTYTIIASADDLTNFDVVMEEDHDDPPTADGVAGPYYGRLLAFKGSRFYWTHQNKPYAFANPDGPDGDWNDLDENAGDIKFISVSVHEAFLYCENEIFILMGDPADAFGEVHPSGITMGTPSRFGVAKIATGGDVAYLGGGIYLVDGTTARKISAKIEPIFQGRAVGLWDGTTAQPIEDPSTVAVGYDDGIVWVSHSNGTLKCDLLSGRWFQDSRVFTCFQAESEVGILGAIKTTNKVVHLNFGFSDNGQAIPLNFLSKAYDFGMNDSEKRVEDITLFSDTGGQDLTVTVYYAEGVGEAFTLNTFGRQRTIFQLNNGDGIRARNFAIGITGSTTFEAIIDSIEFNYYPEAREAKSYDTAVANGGSPKVKLIRELAPDLENDVDVSFKLESDVPSFALTTRETHVLGTNLFRRRDSIVMTSPVYGHDFRVVASAPAGHFRMFELWALTQVIGTYIHGGNGKNEYYLSDVLDFGSERVKLAKEIEVVYSTVGTVTVTLSTDLPGNAIASRGTSTLPATQGLALGFPATDGEQSVKLKLPGTIRGRLYQVRLDPSVDCRVEAIRLWMKMIGEPNATSWQWIDFPLEKTTDAIWSPLSFPADAAG